MKLSVSFAGCAIAGALFFSSACSSSDDESSAAEVPVVANYAALVAANYGDALATAEALKTAIDAFVAAPSENGLEAAKTAWKESRVPYGQTEVYRFYGGPIDDDDGPEGEINAWPLNEGHIDYTVADPNGGIVNSTDPAFKTISKTLIAAQNMNGAEDNVASGYHAIELLLWGQDLSATGPGARPYTDYLTTGGTAKNQDRRGTYLKEAAALLVDDLRSVAEEWAPATGAYVKSFTTGKSHDAVTKIMNGLYRLEALEFRGQRIGAGYEHRDQEDEHSCFSDNTKVDFQMNMKALENVYFGRYGAIDGAGIEDLVKAKDAALDTEIRTKLTAAHDAIEGIPLPYDQAILGDDSSAGRTKVKAALDALQSLADSLLKAADALKVTIDKSEI